MNLLLKCLCILILVIPVAANAACYEAISNGDDAYRYARRAYAETSLDAAQSHVRKARNAADDAKSAAELCGCNEAAQNFDDAYTYARRAYRSSDLSDLKFNARRVMLAAEAGKDAAQNCGS